MDQHPRRLVYRQQPVIFVENVQVPFLRRVFRGFFLQDYGDDIPGLYRVVGVLGQAVDPDGISPLQLVHQPGGHFQLPQQKRGQPSGPGGCDSQFHPITSCVINDKTVGEALSLPQGNDP